MVDKPRTPEPPAEHDSFRELAGFTLAGYLIGLVIAAILDQLGLQRSGWGQWLVRTMAGEGESLFEGGFALLRRLRGDVATMAEAYGWGKVTGMTLPWIIDGVSRLAGVNVYGVEGFYIPFFYSMGDQIGASVAGMIFLRRATGSWSSAMRDYFRHPVMLASLGVIMLVPCGLLAARLLGFSPTTQIATALESIAANLCWIPPVIGWYFARRESTSEQLADTTSTSGKSNDHNSDDE